MMLNWVDLMGKVTPVVQKKKKRSTRELNPGSSVEAGVCLSECNPGLSDILKSLTIMEAIGTDGTLCLSQTFYTSKMSAALTWERCCI